MDDDNDHACEDDDGDQDEVAEVEEKETARSRTRRTLAAALTQNCRRTHPTINSLLDNRGAGRRQVHSAMKVKIKRTICLCPRTYSVHHPTNAPEPVRRGVLTLLSGCAGELAGYQPRLTYCSLTALASPPKESCAAGGQPWPCGGGTWRRTRAASAGCPLTGPAPTASCPATTAPSVRPCHRRRPNYPVV